MHILFVTHYFPPEVNAPASRTYDHCVRWAKKGHDVTVITCNPNCPTGDIYDGYKNRLWPQVEMIDGIRVVRIWTYLAANSGRLRRSLNYFSFLFSVLLFGMFQKRPDVLIATSPQFFCGLGGALLGRLKRTKTVLEVRDIWPASIAAVGAVQNQPMLRTLVALERLMYWLADHIVTVGPGYRDHIEERTAGKAKLSIVTNGVDLKQFQEVPPNENFRQRLGLEGKLVCSYIGTIGMAHGLDVVVRAAKQLKEQGRDDIAFCLVGDGAKRQELEELARQEQVEDLVKFAGLQPKSEVPGVIASSDAILVHLNGLELFTTVIPSKIFEVMAMQRPIILGVKGMARDIVIEANAGIGMEPDDESDLVRIVTSLQDDPAQRREYSETGREFVETFYNRDTLAMEYLSILHQVTGIPEPISAEEAIRSVGTDQSANAANRSAVKTDDSVESTIRTATS